LTKINFAILEDKVLIGDKGYRGIKGLKIVESKKKGQRQRKKIFCDVKIFENEYRIASLLF